MSEPCAHEREFAGTQRDTLTSFIKTSGELVRVTAERDAARATIARVKALAAQWEQVGPSYQSLPEGAAQLRQVLDEIPLRAALEPTDQPKGTKP